MRILYDYQAFSMQTHGGVSRCFAEIYKYRPKNVDVKIGVRESDNVYIREFNGIYPANYKYNKFICKCDFWGKGHLHLWYDKLIKGGYYPDYNQNYSIELLKKGDFDVFHPTFFDDYFLSYLNGKPFVLTIHDMIPWIYSEVNRASWKWQVNQMKILAPLASAIVAVSENTKKDIIRFLGISEEKIHVIYHGCSFPSYGENNRLDFPYILFVGDRGYYKNFDLFVKYVLPVLKHYKEMKIVCTGSPFNIKEKEMLNEYGVGNRFCHHWVTNDKELYTLYHHAKCFVYPSEYEGFGIPLLEAYQAGCPVLLNNASCFPEIAGGAAIYFNLNKEKSNLADKIEYILSMPTEDRKTLLIKQRERLEMYSWEKSAIQLAALYQSICK